VFLSVSALHCTAAQSAMPAKQAGKWNADKFIFFFLYISLKKK
jgi:hypothetical protein